MAALEMRAMLLGIWENVEHLEESVSLGELLAILKAHAEQEHRERKFMAALKGIDIPDPNVEEASSFEDVKKRVDGLLAGKSAEELDFEDLGLDYEG